MSLYRGQFAALRPVGGFQLIMADPPWRYELFNEESGKAKAPQGQYDCMDLAAIKAMPVEMLAAENAVLWLWCTHPMLPEALELIPAWGFEFKTSGVWSKRNPETGNLAFGTGYLLRCASEPFLIATRGKPKTARNVRTVIEGKRREHSRKPEEAYAAAEQLIWLEI